MGNVVLPLLILTATGSATLAGAALFASAAALIATQVFAGALVDQHSPSVVLRLSSLVQATGWVVVLVALLLPERSFLLVLVGATFAGGASGLDGPSEHSLMKAVVPQAQLGHAAGIGQGREAAAGLLGGPLGGAAFAVAPAIALVCQILLNSVAALSTPHVRHTRRKPERSPGFLREVGEGFAVVWNDPGLRGIALVSGLANLPIVALPLTLIAYYQQRGESTFLVGVLTSAFAAGVIAGSFVAGPLSSRFRLGAVGVIALAAFATGQVLVALLYPHLIISIVILALSAFPLPTFNAAISAYTASVTPQHLMGRVTSASGVPGMILMPVGVLGAGILFDAYGAVIPAAISAIAAAANVLVMAGNRALRQIPRLTELSAVGAAREAS